MLVVAGEIEIDASKREAAVEAVSGLGVKRMEIAKYEVASKGPLR